LTFSHRRLLLLERREEAGHALLDGSGPLSVPLQEMLQAVCLWRRWCGWGWSWSWSWGWDCALACTFCGCVLLLHDWNSALRAIFSTYKHTQGCSLSTLSLSHLLTGQQSHSHNEIEAAEDVCSVLAAVPTVASLACAMTKSFYFVLFHSTQRPVKKQS
jgi:hypothetical protein